MDIEVIKEMLTLFGQAGESATELCILWIISQYVPTIIFGMCWSGIAIWVLRTAHRLLITYLVSEKLRRAAGVSSYWSSREVTRAINCLTKNKDEI